MVSAGRRAPAFAAPVPALRPVLTLPRTVMNSRVGPGKDWENYKMTKNHRPVRLPMHVRTGDMVVVITGKYKGKTGRIASVNRKMHQVCVDSVTRTKKIRMADGTEPREDQVLHPIAASNVMHWSEQEQVRSRMGKKWVDGKKVRYLKKTGEVLQV